MNYEYNRRIKKVFKRLAQFVGTRDHSQCKSHHQKMMRTYGKIENIINALKKKELTVSTTIVQSEKCSSVDVPLDDKKNGI